MKVHGTLGNGFKEVIYQRCLAIEMTKQGLKFDRDGKIYDVDSFLKALDALCENSPIEIANIQVSEGDEDVDIRISID